MKQPRKIGKYDVDSVIGEGSFGKVYLGRCGAEEVALKCIPKKTRTQLQIRNLKSETTLLTKIQHPNIIMLKEFIETESELVVVMEYAGNDLSEQLRSRHKLTDERIRLYARQILDAMLYLHQQRILHRDLKPQNILLMKDQIKICDFGFAKQMSASTNFLKSIKGTPLYIAPEILLSRPYTHKVDVWSFGVILYELATGVTPFYANTIQKLQPKILHEPVKFPSTMNPSLRELIDGMLQKSQHKRYDWNKVKSHPFFAEEPTPIKVLEDVPQRVAAPVIEWDAEEQCAYVTKIEADFQEGRVSPKDLKTNQEFCLRITQFFGEACISRTKINKEALLKAIKLVTKLAMQKTEANQEKELAKNKTLMTAIVSLALEETQETFLTAELQLIGFLLKQNFNGIKVDSEHEGDIISLALKQLQKQEKGPATVLCLKVLGILTNQAVMTLAQSQQYFEHALQEKLMTQIAETYFCIPETHTVLECLKAFLHPSIPREGLISHKIKAVLQLLKEEVATVFAAKGFIKEEPLKDRKWNRSSEIQVYSEILGQCLEVSGELREQFVKYSYWEDLISIKNTKMHFLRFNYINLKHTGKAILRNELVKNEIVQEGSDHNKLINVFLLYSAFTVLKNHPTSKNKLDKVEVVLNQVYKALTTDPDIKKKNCADLLGSFAENSYFFDDMLCQILIGVSQEAKKEESLMKRFKAIVEQALLLPLSEQSMLNMLQMVQNTSMRLSEKQGARLSDYLCVNIKQQKFDEYLAVHPQQCSKLLTQLLGYQLERLQDERQLINFSDLAVRHQLVRLLCSQQLATEELVLVSLKVVNKIMCKLNKENFDVLSHSAMSVLKPYFESNREDILIQIIIMCSHLAKINPEYIQQIISSGVIEMCARALNSNSELLQEKTLHLVGNLAKHNKTAFDGFQQHNILAAIAKCLASHRKNQKILKNTIYAIGNISYYSQRFAQQINPMITHLSEGLTQDDEHLLLNTLSTISNLLRHGQAHLTTLIDSNILGRVVELYSKATSADQANFYNNLLKKAAGFPSFTREFDKRGLRDTLEGHIRNGLVRADNENARKLKQLLA